MTRTHIRHTRAFVDGVELSGDMRQFGPLVWEFDVDPQAAVLDEVKNVTLGHAMVQPGVLNSFFNYVTAGHVIHNEMPAKQGLAAVLTYLVGLEAAPAPGDPVFAGRFKIRRYQAEGDGWLAAHTEFGQPSPDAPLDYAIPWGVLLHPRGAETGANGGSYDHDHGAQTTNGGFGVLHVIATDGTCTFSIDHRNAAWANLLTFDTAGDTPRVAEIKALAPGATVERYLRWQLSLGTATSVEFVMAFIRGTGA